MKTIKDIFYAFLSGLIISLVISIAVMLAIAALIQTPVYTTLVVAFFVPFNYIDLRNAFVERRWLAFGGTIMFLTTTSAFIFGLIRFASGFGRFESYFGWILLITFPPLLIITTTYGLCTVLIPNNSAFLGLRQKVEDLYSGIRLLRS